MNREQGKKLLPILQAFTEGKTVQYSLDGVTWIDENENLLVGDFEFDGIEYRIKPEESPCGRCIDSGKEINCGKCTHDEALTGNYTIEQNCGENRGEGGVLSISGSVSEKRFRPFNNCDELVKIYHNRAFIPIVAEGLNQKLKRMYRPEIWVKHKEYGTEFLITAFDNRKDLGTARLPCVCIQDMWVDFEELLEGYTFLDGSPLGKLEE